MNTFNSLVVIIALIGSALIGGVFFAFSSFIMKALARLSAAEGMAAMQSINIVVLNPSFLGVFMGTTILSLLVMVLAIIGWGSAGAPYYLTGALLYFAGTFLVTGMGNVPLNNQLALLTVSDPAATGVWEHYLDRWTLLNTVRTLCALAASVSMLIGLLK